MKPKTTKYRIFLCTIACAAVIPSVKADFLREGREAFMNYDFELATEFYEKFAKSLKKTPDAPGEELLELYERQLEIAENALENVQRIEIIDRIDVPAADFFKYVKLPASGGRLIGPDASALKNRRNTSDFAFTSESGDVMMWSESDDSHRETIMQSERLMDGSWEVPEKAGEILNDGGNARNPFMLSDGLTLYYASDGEGSMGGYDLFVATKDATTGEFRQPMGLGYPFNSPFNEYLMAVDEENGIGWWVTDRNRLDNQLSVYVFKTNDVRKNYVLDDEDDIIELAKVSDITVTQNPDTDYAAILKDIDNRNRAIKNNSGHDFIFPLRGGRIARSLSDFSSTAAKRNMQQYLEALKEHTEVEKQLNDLRKKYRAAGKSKDVSETLSNQIKDLETKRDWQLERLKKMRNSIISAEIKE